MHKVKFPPEGGGGGAKSCNLSGGGGGGGVTQKVSETRFSHFVAPPLYD